MNDLIKLANYQLQRTPDNEVVKVAGLLRRIKNWIKSKFDEEFKDKARKLDEESSQYSSILNLLESQVDKVQNAIKDRELEEYREELSKLKSLLKETLIKVDDSLSDLKMYYTKEDVAKPQFSDIFKKYLPENYDIELNKILNIPLLSTSYYSNFTINDIYFTENAWSAAKQKIIEALEREGIINDNIISSIESKEFINKVKESILNGTLIVAKAKKPTESHSNIEEGQTSISVTSENFFIPKTDILINLRVEITDTSTGISRRKKLTISRTNTVTILNKRASFYSKILKIAEPLPYKVNKLSEEEFVNVMRKGYKLAFNEDPDLPVLAFGWAQAVLESGRPINLPQNNVGNIKATKEWINSGKPYFVKSTEEYTKDGKKFIHENAAWRAFATPEEGAASYWKLISKKFPDAFKLMKQGNPEEAARSLGESGYYTANIDKYSGAVKSLYKEFMKKYNKINKLPDSLIENSDKTEQLLDNFMKKLVASPVTNLVKQALYKKENNKNHLLIKVCGEDELFNTEYARQLSFLIQSVLNGTTQIYKDANKLEIETNIYTNSDARKAVMELSEVLSNKLDSKYNKKIYTIVADNLSSLLPKVGADELYSAQRKIAIISR